jgi:hypothetical protein
MSGEESTQMRLASGLGRAADHLRAMNRHSRERRSPVAKGRAPIRRYRTWMPGRSQRLRRAWRNPLGLAVLLIVLVAGAGSASAATSPADPAPRHGSGFPVPSCAWAPARAVGKALGIRVRALPPVWSTHIAPILRCRFVETKPNLQANGQPIVSIEFRELQRFHVNSTDTFVRGLGTCVARSSCPRPGRPAWLRVSQGISAPDPTSVPFDWGLLLGVEDGLNAIVVQIQNPNGPLPISGEPTAAEKLVRSLLPRFFWR